MIAECEARERPILFSAPMVLAILDGRKTQTRRIIKPQPEHGACRCGYTRTGWAFAAEDDACTCKPIKGPPGDVGDRLWVKETYYDRADYALIGKARTDRIVYAAEGIKSGWRAHPSIFMPRWASRITLEVTGVRCERVGEISHADIAAEGVLDHWDPEFSQTPYNYGRDKEQFAQLWDGINGKKEGCSWDANPWVWVVSFRRIKP